MFAAASTRRTLSETECETRVNKVSQPQLELLIGDVPVGHAAQWQRCLRLIADEVDRVNNKTLAGVFDEKPSTISNALAERDRHYFRAEWMVWLIANGPTDKVLSFLAALRRRELTEPEELPPEVENERRKAAAVKLFGPEGAALIDREVYRR